MIDEARAMIEKGWCAGKAKDGERRCLVGALAEATVTLHIGEDRVPGYLLWREARRYVEQQVPAGYTNLPEYNDRTSQAAVVELLRSTAKLVRE